MSGKKPQLVLVVLVAWIGVALVAAVDWIREFRFDTVGVLSLIAAFMWWLVLLWSLHHLAYQLRSLIEGQAPVAANARRPRVAILYTTCDDFNEDACLSCVRQDYRNFRVLVLDDSKTRSYQRRVREFCGRSHLVQCERVVRRRKAGFKAGNLNSALRRRDIEDWVLLVDADQRLPRHFLSSLVKAMPQDGPEVPFIQASNTALLSAERSPFEQLMALAVPFYYLRDLPARDGFGFVPLLGHAALVSRSAWKAVGGFPEIVSEDLGFALRCAAHGRSGRYVREPVAGELYPFDFNGFVLRLRKYAAGTAELCREELPGFLRGRAHPVEKWDALMQVSWYLLMPLIVLNGFLTAYVLHRLWEAQVPYLHPALPFLYVWMVFTLILLFLSVAKGPWQGVRFYFWSTAVHAAVMPLASWSFVRHLFGGSPTFPVTPKNGELAVPAALAATGTALLGCLTLAAAVAWLSPFTPVLAGHGLAYLLYPLYGRLCSDSAAGVAARAMMYPPGILMLVGLYTVWAAIGLTIW